MAVGPKGLCWEVDIRSEEVQEREGPREVWAGMAGASCTDGAHWIEDEAGAEEFHRQAEEGTAGVGKDGSKSNCSRLYTWLGVEIVLYLLHHLACRRVPPEKLQP